MPFPKPVLLVRLPVAELDCQVLVATGQYAQQVAQAYRILTPLRLDHWSLATEITRLKRLLAMAF